MTKDEQRAAELHRRGCEEFGKRVELVGDDQWGNDTPCTEWDVRALVNHLVNENKWIAPLMQGKTIADVGDALDGDLLGDDPKGAWRASVSEATAAFAAPGAMDQTVELSYGTTPAPSYALEVFRDLVVHAWDLALGIGADDRLDPELVDIVYEQALPQHEEMLASGAFGSEKITPPDDADKQTKLLALYGRRG